MSESPALSHAYDEIWTLDFIINVTAAIDIEMELVRTQSDRGHCVLSQTA